MGISQHASKNGMVKTWLETYAIRRSVRLWSKMSQKWYQKFPLVYPSLSPQALAVRKTERRKGICQVMNYLNFIL